MNTIVEAIKIIVHNEHLNIWDIRVLRRVSSDLHYAFNDTYAGWTDYLALFRLCRCDYSASNPIIIANGSSCAICSGHFFWWELPCVPRYMSRKLIQSSLPTYNLESWQSMMDPEAVGLAITHSGIIENDAMHMIRLYIFGRDYIFLITHSEEVARQFTKRSRYFYVMHTDVDLFYHLVALLVVDPKVVAALLFQLYFAGEPDCWTKLRDDARFPWLIRSNIEFDLFWDENIRCLKTAGRYNNPFSTKLVRSFIKTHPMTGHVKIIGSDDSDVCNGSLNFMNLCFKTEIPCPMFIENRRQLKARYNEIEIVVCLPFDYTYDDIFVSPSAIWYQLLYFGFYDCFKFIELITPAPPCDVVYLVTILSAIIHGRVNNHLTHRTPTDITRKVFLDFLIKVNGYGNIFTDYQDFSKLITDFNRDWLGKRYVFKHGGFVAYDEFAYVGRENVTCPNLAEVLYQHPSRTYHTMCKWIEKSVTEKRTLDRKRTNVGSLWCPAYNVNNMSRDMLGLDTVATLIKTFGDDWNVLMFMYDVRLRSIHLKMETLQELLSLARKLHDDKLIFNVLLGLSD